MPDPPSGGSPVPTRSPLSTLFHSGPEECADTARHCNQIDSQTPNSVATALVISDCTLKDFPVGYRENIKYRIAEEKYLCLQDC